MDRGGQPDVSFGAVVEDQRLYASARDVSLGLLPMTVGIIVASGACTVLIKKLGRTLLLFGLAVILIGCGRLLVLVAAFGTDLSLWAFTPAVFLTGLGMGACYGAIGDIDLDEADSASGSLSAIQQPAAGSGFGSAMMASLTAITAPAVPLIPPPAEPPGTYDACHTPRARTSSSRAATRASDTSSPNNSPAQAPSSSSLTPDQPSVPMAQGGSSFRATRTRATCGYRHF
ncbi:MFS transporter [Spongiactinospora rosea]|uniref:hypothetical protein n=1 Tax=Spongiactinospora rosea TaxID=2248750 RepID=UPI0018F510FF|nr:hypothetical protein [Spongiactinospora rosea]